MNKTNENELVKLQDVWKIFSMGNTEVQALRGINLSIHQGEILSIMGPSGSGKSTCMNMIGCLDRPTKGNVIINGRNTATMNENELAAFRNKTVGFVFQQYFLLPNLSVLENVMLPLRYQRIPIEERRERAEEALVRIGVSRYGNRRAEVNACVIAAVGELTSLDEDLDGISVIRGKGCCLGVFVNRELEKIGSRNDVALAIHPIGEHSVFTFLRSVEPNLVADGVNAVVKAVGEYAARHSEHNVMSVCESVLLVIEDKLCRAAVTEHRVVKRHLIIGYVISELLILKAGVNVLKHAVFRHVAVIDVAVGVCYVCPCIDGIADLSCGNTVRGDRNAPIVGGTVHLDGEVGTAGGGFEYVRARRKSIFGLRLVPEEHSYVLGLHIRIKLLREGIVEVQIIAVLNVIAQKLKIRLPIRIEIRRYLGNVERVGIYRGSSGGNNNEQSEYHEKCYQNIRLDDCKFRTCVFHFSPFLTKKFKRI